jgi:hypothetical protein
MGLSKQGSGAPGRSDLTRSTSLTEPTPGIQVRHSLGTAAAAH